MHPQTHAHVSVGKTPFTVSLFHCVLSVNQMSPCVKVRCCVDTGCCSVFVSLYNVCLQGATVKNEGDSVLIARIVQGGAAEKSGKFYVYKTNNMLCCHAPIDSKSWRI